MTKLEVLRDKSLQGKEAFEKAFEEAQNEGFERFCNEAKKNGLFDYLCKINRLEDLKKFYCFGFNDAAKLAFTDVK